MQIPSSHSRRSAIDLQAAMTPLIDVVFQLLIFFICASTGHLRELLLPTDFAAGALGNQAPAQIERPLGEFWIRLRQELDETVIQVEGREFRELAEVSETLRALVAASKETPVILDIQPDVPLGAAIEVYDACRAARFQSISFAADSKPKTAKPAR